MVTQSRAPLRLGLAGGGTEVSRYCDEFGGAILNATIGLYAYASNEPNSDGLVTIVSSDQSTSADIAPMRRSSLTAGWFCLSSDTTMQFRYSTPDIR